MTWEPNEATAREYDREFLVWGECGGRWHGARPMIVTPEKLQEVWEKHSKHRSLFNDHVERSFERFKEYMVNRVRLPVEVVTLPEMEHAGFLYLTDPWVQSETGPMVIEAFGHISFWDGDFAHRRELVRELIAVVAKAYNIHRLLVRVPTYARGAVRAAIKLGFNGPLEAEVVLGHEGSPEIVRVEGLLRKSVQYDGKWYDSILLSLVGDELWDSSRK